MRWQRMTHAELDELGADLTGWPVDGTKAEKAAALGEPAEESPSTQVVARADLAGWPAGEVRTVDDTRLAAMLAAGTVDVVNPPRSTPDGEDGEDGIVPV